MQFIKILLWVLLLVASFVFWWTNEARSSLDLGAAVVESRVSTFTLGAFLLGLVPLWLIHRAVKWRLTRRIKTLEAAARPAPISTPTPDQTPAPSTAPDGSIEKFSGKPETPAVASVSDDRTDKEGKGTK
ncbi:hypothetical protein MNBD_ALPHA04-1097 [hydrothermal vent metagenome]|uniref:Lipopolysaccharide assembly protein A domain-containing protein n=1 Tax=hydrothermal vent metagenome TaxID=652676 RepID=A0A3B0T0B5_9ZZZZ